MMDIQDLEGDDGSFESVIYDHGPEHVPDDASEFEERFRVMHPGAQAPFPAPLDADWDEIWDPTEKTPKAEVQRACGRFHVRLYGVDFPDLLRVHGFVEEEIAVTDDDDARYCLRTPLVDRVILATRPL